MLIYCWCAASRLDSNSSMHGSLWDVFTRNSPGHGALSLYVHYLSLSSRTVGSAHLPYCVFFAAYFSLCHGELSYYAATPLNFSHRGHFPVS
ncbi:hypothetical protein MVEN_02310200 [Mycena venus]|uniref:Uncharacterized protein n=1 Tax=Mycena venus TaxID=2733690 RepID=A0A8H7CF15_9AGAR|nr:hypothetical protein MVEN_02310200 [Mycena venus]